MKECKEEMKGPIFSFFRDSIPEVREDTEVSSPSWSKPSISTVFDPTINAMKNVWTSLKAPIKSLLRLEKREVSQDSLPEAIARKSRNVSKPGKVSKMFRSKMETFCNLFCRRTKW